jgi:hypothetical protein
MLAKAARYAVRRMMPREMCELLERWWCWWYLVVLVVLGGVGGVVVVLS